MMYPLGPEAPQDLLRPVTMQPPVANLHMFIDPHKGGSTRRLMALWLPHNAILGTWRTSLMGMTYPG